MNGGFWELLTKLEQLLILYCTILNILQTDKVQLFEILHGFAYLYQFWQKYSNSNMANGILIQLEKRWELWEQPLFILSWLFHPAYKSHFFTLPLRLQISYLHIGKWLIYYYKVWTGKDPVFILKEFDEFHKTLNILLVMHLLLNLKMKFINTGVGFEMFIQKLESLQHIFLEFVLMLYMKLKLKPKSRNILT
jgi:hypothetical protein